MEGVCTEEDRTAIHRKTGFGTGKYPETLWTGGKRFGDCKTLPETSAVGKSISELEGAKGRSRKGSKTAGGGNEKVVSGYC